MTPGAIVGLDLGTTNGKAYAFGPDGTVLARVQESYPLHTPEPGYVEQDAAQVRDAGLRVLAGVAHRVREQGADIRALALSGAMHSLVGLDERDEPLTPGITYADTRALAQADALVDGGHGATLHRRTGTPVHTMSPLTKLRWYAEQRPEIAEQVTAWVSTKELLLRRLTGEAVVDRSIAASSGLLALGGDWDEEALRAARVSADRLARPVATTTTLTLRADVADDLGLPAGTPVVVGGSDGCLANLGSGVGDAQTAALSIGTSGALRVTATEPLYDEALFSYPLLPGFWAVGGAISNGGLVLDWLLDGFVPEVAREAEERGVDPHSWAVQTAAQTSPGAEGLLFLPALTGERSPTWDAHARGSMIGLTRRHDHRHVIRAALEGMALQLRWVLESLRAAGPQPQRIAASGGFAQSPPWVQLVADVLQTPVVLASPDADTACRGAALLARLALDGGAPSDVVADVPMGAETEPRPEHADLYAGRLRVLRSVHDALEALWRELPVGPTHVRQES